MVKVNGIVERAVRDGVILLVIETECYYPKPSAITTKDGVPGLWIYDTARTMGEDEDVWFTDYPGYEVWSAAGVKGGIHVTLIRGGE